MKKRLAILWLENAAALIHVLAMTCHETAGELRKSDRKPRVARKDAAYQDWMEGAGIKRR